MDKNKIVNTRARSMDTKWDFDAPQFVDFTQPDAHAHEYDESWFDRHTEADDFFGIVREKESGDDSAKKQQMKKPQRIAKGGPDRNMEHGVMEPMEIDSKSHSDKKVKPTRVHMAENNAPQTTGKDICPSPKKRQRLSEDNQDCESTSPAANTRSHINSTKTTDKTPNMDCPAVNTRQQTPKLSCETKSRHAHQQAKSKSPKKNLKAVRSFVGKFQGKSPKKVAKSAQSPQKPGRLPGQSGNSATRAKVTPVTSLKNSQSLRSKILPKAISTSSLLKQNEGEAEKRSSDSSGKGKQQETDSKTCGSSSKVKSTEQLELQKIAAMKKELARNRKLAEESYKKAMASQSYIPMRSTQPATLPQGFHFKTDGRVKIVEGQAQEHKVRDFTKSLREALPQPTLPKKPQVHGLTRPQPFKLTSAKSTSSLQQSKKYESVAERVVAFHNKTPDRFRSRPGGTERSRSATKSNTSGSERRLRSQSPKLTIAKTPTLTTRGRSRPVHALSREEKEQLEFEEHQKQQFRANPVKQKIFDAPHLPQAPAKAPTVPEEFNFHYKKSVSVGDLRGTGTEVEEERFEFHAKPVNTKILAGPVGVKPVEPQPVTVPESPAFALKNRVRIPVELPEQDKSKNAVKANPVPYTGIPFRPRLAHRCTIPEPFEVESRSKEMLSRREQKIQQVLEEERKAHEFHAQGLPSDSPDALPPKQLRPLTLPEPFQLEVDERGQRYQEELKAKIEEEERLAHEAAKFKARPGDVIHKEPFQPQKSSRPLTEISDFALNTDIRAAQREHFDQHLKAREAELEALKRQREERLEQEEKEAIARMRHETVHKATGIKKYKNIVVKPSDKPCTEPQSPRFSQRIRTRHNNSDV